MLRVVPAPPAAAPDVQFCGHCGQSPPTPMAARSRVCALCGLGVVISASADVAPKPGDSFVIVDRSLSLCALSRSAEKLLLVDEPDAVHRHISEFFEPADAEAGAPDELLRSIIAIAGGHAGSQTIVVRPTGEYGVRFAARVGPCGPPAGALLVLSAL